MIKRSVRKNASFFRKILKSFLIKYVLKNINKEAWDILEILNYEYWCEIKEEKEIFRHSNIEIIKKYFTKIKIYF